MTTSLCQKKINPPPHSSNIKFQNKNKPPWPFAPITDHSNLKSMKTLDKLITLQYPWCNFWKLHECVGRAHILLKVNLINPFCLFGDEKLKIIWPSHSIAQRTFSITWMQSVVHITNDFFKRGPWYWKTWLENTLVVFLLIITLVQKIKWTILVKCSTTTTTVEWVKRWIFFELHGGWKPWQCKD